MKQIGPEPFLRLLEEGENIHGKYMVIDVRETVEWNYYHLEGTEHIPMNTIPGRLGELPEDVPLYVICAHGVRSEMVCAYLQQNGYEHMINVEGGMAAVSGLRGFAYD
ncbi:rhodanese-like domain-containing protein [Paenibacillus sp. FJAT-26967]|uniref:rhodanese-like domain-containing protein n=1 Tax=Paenibacillus sp. FJAT-26967 TaxID=1729690 RepID=UPI000837E9A1|nr:rhodanese-like domain-containing protein [Paenibacillus sp. FJAT-26967]